jgi:hypothetical protein
LKNHIVEMVAASADHVVLVETSTIVDLDHHDKTVGNFYHMAPHDNVRCFVYRFR